jgi:hypothetical protein
MQARIVQHYPASLKLVMNKKQIHEQFRRYRVQRQWHMTMKKEWIWIHMSLPSVRILEAALITNDKSCTQFTRIIIMSPITYNLTFLFICTQ